MDYTTYSEITEDLRQQILGTTELGFSGLELSLGVKLNNLRAEVIMPSLSRNDAEVRGLTGTQFVTSITFVGGFPLQLKKKESTTDGNDSL